MKEKTIYRTFHRQLQGGVSLVETTIALGILLIAMAGVMTITMVAMTTTENQGHLAARATEYAQDKMEQLISLAYGDGDLGTGTGTDTTVFPAPDTGGAGLAVRGSSDPSTPVAGYVDYLDRSGNLVSSTGSWYYIRAWQIDAPSGTTSLKPITVTARVRSGVGSKGVPPRATIISLKTLPFLGVIVSDTKREGSSKI